MSSASPALTPPSEFPTGGGAMAAAIRAKNWSATPLGPIATWPESLKAVVQLLLSSRHPMFLWWGPELIQLYNDAYVPSFGRGKHPAALGQRGADCWQEIWPIIGPQIEGVMTGGVATWHEDALVPIFRNGKIEEVYWTYGYSPVFDERRAIAGTLVVCTETTMRVLAERRQHVFRALAEQVSVLREPAAVLAAAFASFAAAQADIPFALAFAHGVAQPSHSNGLAPAALHALATRREAFEAMRVPTRVAAGDGVAPITELLVVPVRHRATLVFGIAPALSFDAAYQAFLVQLADHIALSQDRIESDAIRAAAEAERRDLLLQAPVATALLTGPQHLFALANELYEEMVGRPVQGKTYLEAFPELAGTPLPGILDDVYQRGVPFVTHEMHIPLDRRKTGVPEDGYFRFNLQPIRNASGDVFGMMAVAVEITALVQTRRQQEEAHARLQQAHDERTQLVRELEAASHAKDEFLAMLGHELRNPLAPIVTALEIQKLRQNGPPSSEQNVIDRQVHHLTRLVDDLLDVSKITRGKVELKPEVIDIADALGKAVEMASYLIEKRQHRLRVRAPDTALRWWGDPMRLAQIVANLLTNAARYTAPGGDIDVVAARDGADVVIRVADNGIGMSPQLLPTVFDLFIQGNRSRTSDRAEGGLGIGLTLVRSLVELHGGRVAAHSAGEGHGSEFVVRLPLRDADERPAAAPAPRTPRSLAAKRVLVVDDNQDAADLLADLLRDAGHDVRVAYDAAAALRLAPALAPEVAVLDIGLPVIDGYGLAARLREIEALAPCRLIALTGYGQDTDRARARAAGFARHLVKPVKVADLFSAILDDELGER